MAMEQHQMKQSHELDTNNCHRRGNRRHIFLGYYSNSVGVTLSRVKSRYNFYSKFHSWNRIL